MPRSAYPLAMDAAPQDGRWLDDPAAVNKVLLFLVSKLSPADLAELDRHLTEGTTPGAQDHRIPASKVKDNLLLYTPRNRRGVIEGFVGARPDPLAMDTAERDAIHKRLFPHADRLK